MLDHPTDLPPFLPDPADEAYLASLHGDDHDQQPDPEALELWTQRNDDYYEAEHDLWEADAEARAWVEEEWAARAHRREIHEAEAVRVFGHLAHAVA